MLTKRQKEILNIIKADKGINLTTIAKKLNLAKSVVSVHIKNLVAQEFLEKEGRLLRPTKKNTEAVTHLPYYGLAQCGYNDILTEDNVVSYVPMPTEFLPMMTDDLFLIKAKGDSMEPSIADGELLLLKKKKDLTLSQNDILLCFHNEGLKLKRIKYIADENGHRHPFLVSDNKAYYEPIAADETTHIVGKLIKGFKDYK